ncbi:hypothetical protein COOONC_27825 [Cooperia oncophora]
MVEKAQPKKTAVIVDFRKDKSELINYRNEHVITVITVPYDLVVNGLIFTSLRNQLEVGQRPLLHRIGSCDLVVLMSDAGIELINGQPKRGSKAHLLSMALYEYNHEHPPKSPPLFMDGGFDNWRDQYPMYTKGDGTLKRPEPKDQLDHMVINYKRACLMLDYPDLSPPRPSAQQPRVAPTVNGLKPTDEKNQSLKHVPNATVIRTDDVDVQNAKRMETTFSAHDSAISTSSIKSTPVAPQSSAAATSVTVSPKVAGDGDTSTTTSQPPSTSQKSAGQTAPTPPAPSLQSPAESSKHDSGVDQPVASGYHPSVTVGPPPSVPSRMPMVDRSNKPNQQYDTAQESRLEAVHIAPLSKINAHPSQPRLPLPDRSTKPVLISIDQEQQLLDIYNSMCDSTEGSSNRRGTPRPGYTGLYNMGNTCFMNATLQALFHTPLMLSIFSKENFMSRVNP